MKSKPTHVAVTAGLCAGLLLCAIAVQSLKNKVRVIESQHCTCHQLTNGVAAREALTVTKVGDSGFTTHRMKHLQPTNDFPVVQIGQKWVMRSTNDMPKNPFDSPRQILVVYTATIKAVSNDWAKTDTLIEHWIDGVKQPERRGDVTTKCSDLIRFYELED